MKKLLTITALLAFAFILQAQTRRIALRSHSGKDAALYSETDGNFGISPEMEERWRKYADSVRRADSTHRADSLRRLAPGPADTNTHPHPQQINEKGASHGKLIGGGMYIHKAAN